MLTKKIAIKYIVFGCISLLITGCKVPAVVDHKPVEIVPESYNDTIDQVSASSSIPWRQFFNDPYLQALIDTALKKNQELLITLQEIEIAKSDVNVKDS